MRVVVQQAIESDRMCRKEPKQTKMISFVGRKTNMYLVPMGGGMALIHCNSLNPGRSWDGFIFDQNSDELIQNMIEGLQWLQRNREHWKRK